MIECAYVEKSTGVYMVTDNEVEPVSLNIAVLVVSDSRNEKTDKSGPLLQERIESAGHSVIEKKIVEDDIYQIRSAVAGWCADQDVDVVLTTGGTGVTGRDGTPEAISCLLDKIIDGFGEVFRSISFDEIGTSSLQSRAMAGVANGTYVFVLPGSSGACATAWDKLISLQLDSRTKPCNLVELMPRLKEK
ncbi:MAG: molybdenum cofactor biosynthesis protein B [Gammaproteobacteria bacterium]|jgi:molybdenum cofactor biosynthesis protein B